MLFLAVWPSGRQAAAQQVFRNRATTYLFPTDISDARAIWVNPAGLGIAREASVYGEASVGDPGSHGRLRQINAGFNSRGLAFGYQRDIFDDGTRGNTFRLGLAGGAGGLAAGFDVTHYRGSGAKETGWDLGVSYQAYPVLRLGLVMANLGQPTVRGIQQRLTFVPAATWHPRPLGPFGVSTLGRITPDAVESFAFGASWSAGGGTRWPVAVIARLDTDRDLRRGAFAFGISLGGENRFGAVLTAPGDISRLDAVSLYGLATRLPGPGRR